MKDLLKEKELLEKAQIDKKSFDQLYKYFLNDVYRFSYSIVGNQHDAEDITSKVFIEFYKKIDSFEWKDVSLKSWLFQTARFVSYKNYKLPVIEEFNDDLMNIDMEKEISFVDEVINQDLLEEVKKEVQNLKPVEREIINLRIWEDLPFAEIAQIENMNESAVKKRFYRSIEKIKEGLKSRNVRSVIALPVLFTALKQMGATSVYAAPATLAAVAVPGLVASQAAFGTTAGATATAGLFGLKSGLVAVATSAVVVAGIGGAIVYDKVNENKTEDKKVLVTPRPVITTTPTITSTPSVTTTVSVTPTSDESLTEYRNEDYGFSLLYDKNLDYKCCLSSRGESLYIKHLFSIADLDTVWQGTDRPSDSFSAQAITVENDTEFQNQIRLRKKVMMEQYMRPRSESDVVEEELIVSDMKVIRMKGVNVLSDLYFIQLKNNNIDNKAMLIFHVGRENDESVFDDNFIKVLESITLFPKKEVQKLTYTDSDINLKFDYPENYQVKIEKEYTTTDSIHYEKEISITNETGVAMTINYNNYAQGCAGTDEKTWEDNVFTSGHTGEVIARSMWINTADASGNPEIKLRRMIYMRYSSPINGEGYPTSCGWMFGDLSGEMAGKFTVSIIVDNERYYSEVINLEPFDAIVRSVRGNN